MSDAAPPDELCDEDFLVGAAVSRVSDGQRGRVVMHEGRKLIRIDRPPATKGMDDPLVPLDLNLWERSDERPPLGKMQIARIQWDAVKSLRRCRGEYGVRDWESVSDDDRATFAALPPLEPEQRRVWEAVRTALKGGPP